MNPDEAKKLLALGFLRSGGSLDWVTYQSLDTGWKIAFEEAGAEHRSENAVFFMELLNRIIDQAMKEPEK